MSIVITHHQYGIFIGCGLGLGFWSNLDNAGQNRAAVFENKKQAENFVSSWQDGNNIDDYKYVEVNTEDHFYATIEELKDAGLENHLGELIVNSFAPKTLN